MSSIFDEVYEPDTSGHFELFESEGEDTLVVGTEDRIDEDLSIRFSGNLFEDDGVLENLSHEGSYKANDFTSIGRTFDAAKAARDEVENSQINHGFKRKTSEEMADEYDEEYQRKNREQEQKEADKQAKKEERAANRAHAKEDLKEGMKDLGGALVQAAKATGKGVKETARIAYNLALGKNVGGN